MEVDTAEPPEEGVWRIGREPNPLASSRLADPVAPGEPHTGNRFDSPTGTFGVVYFATTLEGCFGETLARFRPDSGLKEIIGQEWLDSGFMDFGDIPAEWRQRRVALNVAFPRSTLFLDVESIQTRETLSVPLAPLLALYGHQELDVPTVRGRDRRITRYISQWAYEQSDQAGRPLYAGIRYLSRLSSEWECWAVFDRLQARALSRRPILARDPALRKIAKLYHLTPY